MLAPRSQWRAAEARVAGERLCTTASVNAKGGPPLLSSTADVHPRVPWRSLALRPETNGSRWRQAGQRRLSVLLFPHSRRQCGHRVDSSWRCTVRRASRQAIEETHLFSPREAKDAALAEPKSDGRPGAPGSMPRRRVGEADGAPISQVTRSRKAQNHLRWGGTIGRPCTRPGQDTPG